ncbi:right-handed parallel beta-helix repeat-containing protein [Micromonospora avicenniae]|uniref:right-handed parallel beta-helix repeat-containing protein n=1 Tax=Micromonospora avicenniae TaxID=1198245 RepID=UPI00343B3201
MNDRFPNTTSASTSRRPLWLATGVAGLTGIFGVFGVSVAGASAAAVHHPVGMTLSTVEAAVDGTAKDVSCDTSALITELTEANRTNGGMLNLAANCTYTLTGSGAGTAAALTGNGSFPIIEKPITILGNGSTFAHGGEPGFRVLNVGPGGHLILQGLTIRGGDTSGPKPQPCPFPIDPDPEPGSGDGAGILVQPGGTADIEDSVITENESCGRGGGIANFGTTSLRDSVVSNNRASVAGGGIFNAGELTIQGSRVESNTAKGTGKSGADGGGIANDGGGDASITSSQIAHNRAGNDGGGLHNDGNATLLVDHSTVAGNSATSNGGGLFQGGATASVRNSTFTLDIAGLFDTRTRNLNDRSILGNHARQGGAIYNDTGATLEVSASRIIGNFASTRAGAGGIHNNNGAVTLANSTWIKFNPPRNCVNVPGCGY